ncbi:MAG: hypothetical protein WC554_10650 [Clostridia bacterium]|jgi:DNA-directed RNA polymerase specialized sigma24 family protein
MMKRNLTIQEEELIRLIHHEFMGLEPKTAAASMGIPVRKVYSLIEKIKCKAPQLFPILTAAQFKVYKLLVEDGLNYEEVAKKMRLSVKQVDNIVRYLHAKGFRTEQPKTVRYENFMDDKVVERF